MLWLYTAAADKGLLVYERVGQGRRGARKKGQKTIHRYIQGTWRLWEAREKREGRQGLWGSQSLMNKQHWTGPQENRDESRWGGSLGLVELQARDFWKWGDGSSSVSQRVTAFFPNGDWFFHEAHESQSRTQMTEGTMFLYSRIRPGLRLLRAMLVICQS